MFNEANAATNEVEPEEIKQEVEEIKQGIEDQVEDQNDPVTEETEDEKYSKRVQKRISKEVWEKNELKRRLEVLEAELAKASAPPAIKTLGDGAPDPEQFPAGRYDPDYQEALADFKAKQAVDNYKKSVSNAQKEAAITKLAEAAQQSHEDYGDAIESFREHPLSENQNFNEILMESDNPIELAYYLGKNPDELDKIAQMQTIAQASRYIGKIEAQMNTDSPTPPKPAQSKAPAPLSSLKPSSSTATKDPEKMSMEEFVAWSKANRK